MKNCLAHKRLLATFALACVLFANDADASSSPTKARTFLKKQLPLSLVLTTPVELAGSGTGSVSLYGRQAITAVFSRPVIALGSDFGNPAAQQKLPFQLSCGVPGKLRWVTTTIARFDPDVDWPTDLDCTLQWTTSLTSYDGALLRLGDTSPQRTLTSGALNMYLSYVTSEAAMSLTDGLWTSSADNPPEVPPDGKMVTSFNYPVNLELIKSALQMVEADNPDGAGVAVDVGPCQSSAPWAMMTMGGATTTTTLPLGLSLDVNTTCAEVRLKSPLKPNTGYLLRLVRGARYNALAGPLREEARVPLSGLRPFAFPFMAGYDDYRRGTSFRRLDLWLRHGLSADTPPEALSSQISLCELDRRSDADCTNTPFVFSLVSRGKARLTVQSLKPRTKYTISVAANPAVKDGYGQGLQGSEASFWTSAVNYNFAGPETSYGSRFWAYTSGGYWASDVAVLEAGIDSLQSWPLVTRSPMPGNYMYPSLTSSVLSWEVNLLDDRVKALVAKVLIQATYNNYNIEMLFGKPTQTLEVPAPLLTAESNTDWTELLLPLRDATTTSKARLISTCCSTAGPRASTIAAKLVLNTSLSVNLIQSGSRLTAWVLDGALGGGPVSGAVVTVFHDSRDGPTTSVEFTQADPVLLAECTTGPDGVCVMTSSSAEGTAMMAFVVAGDQVAVLRDAGVTRVAKLSSQFVSSLVADRLVVVPGDTLKITGFVQQISATGLQLPPASYAVLSVSPMWQEAAGSQTSGSPGLGGKAGRRRLEDGSEVIGAAETLSVTASSMPLFMGGGSLSGDMSRMPQNGGESVSGAQSRYLVKLNGTTGTLHGEIPVPADARMQPYTLTLNLPALGDTNGDLAGPEPSLDSFGLTVDTRLGFTVADPRPPTAELKLEASPWVAPRGIVAVNVTAVSYIGASVDGAPISVTWRHSKAAGVIKLVTDVHGFAVANIDLGGLPEANRTIAYDTMSVNAEWIGPTRERITQSSSVLLADGPARLALQLSLQTDTPGIAFAVAATLTSNTDGQPTNGVPVAVTLRPALNDPTAGTLCATTASCSISSGATLGTNCQLALPCVGHFELEACANVPAASSGGAPQRVCASQPLGRNVSEWAAQPLWAHPNPTLYTNKKSYSVGEQVKLILQNPWPNARMLILWGSSFKTESKMVTSLPIGLVEVAIGPLGDESVGGCTVLAVLDVPRASSTQPPLPPPEQLRVSRLFDPRAPHTHAMTATLDVRRDNVLSVSVAVAAASSTTIQDVDGDEVLAIEPGSEAQVSVTVESGVQGGAVVPAAGSVEVTVYAVDKAFLDLMPYDLPHLEQEMVLRLATEISHYGLARYRLAPGAVRAVFDKLMARLTGIDPWLPVDTTVLGGNVPAVDVDDAAYLTGYATALTPMPYSNVYYNDAGRYQREPMMDVMASGMASGTATADKAPEKGTSATNAGGSTTSTTSSSTSGGRVAVRQEADFLVTPLYATATTGADGRATVSFTAPPNLGTFVIRAFAASGSTARYGSGEGKVAVRRRLSLTPSVPRFVRVGDTFEAGAVVTVGSAPATITVTLKVNDEAGSPFTLTGTSLKELVFAAGGGLQKEVRFSFSAAAIGTANLTFSASDGQPGGGQDGLQLEIPVLGQQGDVWVATSFALTATLPSDTNTVQWQEGLSLPDAVPGSGGLTLTAGVGYYPAIASVYDNLLREEPDRTHAYAPASMLWATLPALLSYYNQPTSAAQAAAVAKSFSDLALLTKARVGLMWSDPTRWGSWMPDRTDTYLNTWALFLAAQHSSAAVAPSFWNELGAAVVPMWRTAVATQLVQDAGWARAQPYPFVFNDWRSLSWAMLVLGQDWVPYDVNEVVRQDLSLATLISNEKDIDGQTRVVLALVLQSMGDNNPSRQLLSNTINAVTSALRVQGRTAYVASSAGLAAPAPLEQQAMSLLLLLRAGVTHQLLPKLAAYVASPTPVGGYGMFSVGHSYMEQGLAMAALSEYDRVRGSSKPNVELLADANGLTVLEATFRTGGSTQPVTNTTAWEEVPAAPVDSGSELNFQATGSGEVTVAASLHFVPAALLTFPTYRGLYVESAVQLIDPLTGGPTGQRLASVPLGSVVALTVQVTTPDDLGAVTLSVMMPGGLEPLDPNVAVGVDTSCDAGWVDSWAWGSFYRWWWWPMCPAQETRPSVVTFSYLALRAGTSTVTVRAVAATAGSFVVPPTRAVVDKQPELMGMTAAARLTVCAECTAPTYGVAPPPPNGCPSACSGNGVCNLKTGRCRCDAGYTRADCSRPVA